jgi:hypothetical protein
VLFKLEMIMQTAEMVSVAEQVLKLAKLATLMRAAEACHLRPRTTGAGASLAAAREVVFVFPSEGLAREFVDAAKAVSRNDTTGGPTLTALSVGPPVGAGGQVG